MMVRIAMLTSIKTSISLALLASCLRGQAMFFSSNVATTGGSGINTTPVQTTLGAINTFVVAYPSNNTAGNLNTVIFDNEGGSDHVTGVTDSVGNAYTFAGAGHDAGGTTRTEIWYAPNIGAGANTVTVAITGGVGHGFVALQEWAGASHTTPLDAFTGSTTVSGTAGPVVTTGANELLLLGFTDGGSGTACSTGFTTINSTVFYDFFTTQRKASTTAGSYSGTSCGSGNAVTAMAAFK